MARYAPIHPGEILKTEFLDELGITPYALAKNAGIDKGNLSRMINGKSAITADTALRLAKFFGTSAESWMNLQSRYDLEMAKDHGLGRIERGAPLRLHDGQCVKVERPHKRGQTGHPSQYSS